MKPDAVTRVWLIRHGESESNAGLITSDTATITLTAQGVAQARSVARLFSDPPGLIVISPYQRTKETARPTIERFPATPVEEWPVHEFTYLSASRCQNTSSFDRKPMAKDYWAQCDPNYADGDDAESLTNFFGRIHSALNALGQIRVESVAVFTHGLFMKGLLWNILTGSLIMNADQMRKFRAFASAVEVPNASAIELKLNNSRPTLFSGILTSHL